jgi:hypothetical protein
MICSCSSKQHYFWIFGGNDTVWISIQIRCCSDSIFDLLFTVNLDRVEKPEASYFALIILPSLPRIVGHYLLFVSLLAEGRKMEESNERLISSTTRVYYARVGGNGPALDCIGL